MIAVVLSFLAFSVNSLEVMPLYRRPYNYRWQQQPMVVTKEPGAVDVTVPAWFRPAINGPAAGGKLPPDGMWREPAIPHPNGPSYRARPLKIWRKRVVRERSSSGKASGAGIGMPMDYPGRLSASGKGVACRTSRAADRCGGAILKDDVKSRSVTLPVQKTVPSDSFYDAAALRTTCVACNPETNVIRAQVRPVLGPVPGRPIFSPASQSDRVTTSSALLVEHANTMFITKSNVVTLTCFKPETIEEAKELVFSGENERLGGKPLIGFTVFPDSMVRSCEKCDGGPRGGGLCISEACGPFKISVFSLGACKATGSPNPFPNPFDTQKGLASMYGCTSYVIERLCPTYIEAASSYRGYFYSRCLGYQERQGRGERIPGLRYFNDRGVPIPPSGSQETGPPNYYPPGCPRPAVESRACRAAYKTSNPRFGMNGAVSSSARLVRAKYEGATSGSHFITAGSLYAKNFGEFSTNPPSGYFLAQDYNNARCTPGLYRKNGSKVSCFTPAPTALDRIEH